MTSSSAHLDIFIPHWGEPSYLRKAVDSVLQQTDSRWKLTIVDDATGGPEGNATRDYLFELDDPRIHVVVKSQNEGITENFRTCAKLATAELVTIMGNDDLLLPNYVSQMLSAISEHNKADIIQPAVQVVDDWGNAVLPLADRVKQQLLRPRSNQPILLEGDRLGASLMHGDWLYWPSLCFRREMLQAHDFRDQFEVIQDLALLMDMFFSGARLLVLPNKGNESFSFKYRRHEASASSVALTNGARFKGERDFYSHIARIAVKNGWSRTARASRLHITSRAHALSLLPHAVLRFDGRSIPRLLRHAFGP